MATETFIGGYRNNTPNDPENWTPYGVPAPGDTALMNSGTMNIGLGQFTADILTLGQGQTPSGYVFNLFDGARLAITTAEFATVGATVNVDGRATATFKQANPSSATYTVNLLAGSALVGNYALNFDGIKVTAATGATFENDGASGSGGVVSIGANVTGTGSFTVRALQGTAGSLEFGRSVAASETIELSGNVYRFSGNVNLLVDRPQDFHAAVNLSDGTIDLKNFSADSYTISGDTLKLYSAGAIVDTLQIHNTTTAANTNTGPIVPLSVDRLGADILISAGANPVSGKVALPIYQPPPPPGHVAAVNIFDTTTNAAVPDTLSHPYAAPVSGIQTEFIDLSPDNLNIAAVVPNMFIHSGAGTDAIDVSRVNGNNILDGSTGSNFLVGGSGADTFFVDARALTADVWSSVVNFHSGDAATIFGVTPSSFAFDYEDNQGAVGAKGLTLHATAPGKPTASITLAGYTKADLGNGRLGVSFSDATAASPYLYIHAT